MRARVRNHMSLFTGASTALALLVLATARLPDPPPAGPSTIAAVRLDGPPAATTDARGVAIRIGLATLLITGLAVRLRAED